MLTNVKEKAIEMEMDLEKVKVELKRLQSIKCRLRKQKARKDYEAKMTEVLRQEQLLKEVRDYIEPKKLTVTTMTAEQIAELDYEETVRAIKSIQSKKCLTQYEEDQVEYNKACAIETVLKEHRSKLQPGQQQLVRKSDINTLLESIQNQDNVDKSWLMEQLEALKQQ